jgi:hypothetical protein
MDISEQADPPNPGNKTMKKLDYGKLFPDNPADTDPLWKKAGKMVANVPGLT